MVKYPFLNAQNENYFLINNYVIINFKFTIKFNKNLHKNFNFIIQN